METLGTLINENQQKKTKIQVSLDSELVQNAERKLSCYGMTRTSALNMFYHAIANSDKFPFTPKLSSYDKAMEDLGKAIASSDTPVITFNSKEETERFLKDDAQW